MSTQSTASSERYLRKLSEARKQTDKLFALLRPGAIYERAVAERHRFIFYLGHLEAFDWNQFAIWHRGAQPFHPTFDRLFEAGIDPGGDDLPRDVPPDWPSVDEVEEYIGGTRARIDALIKDPAGAWTEETAAILEMAIEHRQMHAETLAYLLHNLPCSLKNAPALGDALPSVCEGRPAVAAVPAGHATLGRERDSGFGWDNEFEAHSVHVPAFAMDVRPVTNRDYLRFVEEGAGAPHFWEMRAGAWHYRGMFGLSPLPLESPVYATQAEAAAYALWRGKELPTEAQFHRAAYGTPTPGEERLYPWGDAEPRAIHGNFAFQTWDPVCVAATPAGESAFGISQLVGNGWEWTSTVFAPFPGFRSHPQYPGYSANFFDHDHYVMKGASPRTAACFLRRSFRNWFRSDYPYVYAKFRCVEN